MQDNQSKRILVVEDDDSLRNLYITILQEAGFTIESSSDGNLAFDAMFKGGFDLVLLDIMLPGMDGLTILNKLSQNQPLSPNKHIVIISNVGQDEAIAKAMALGAQGYLIKSDYTPDQIVEQVNSFLKLPPANQA
jgi:CheY-like chemotaxis protein